MTSAEDSLWAKIELHHTVRELFTSRVELSHVRRLLPTKLIHVLVGASGKQATELRDMVFALYGVLSGLNVTLPAPDYTKPIASVYHEATRTISECDQSLEVLSHIDGISRLPSSRSWIFNWLDRYHPQSISSSQFSATCHTDRESRHRLNPLFILSNNGQQLVVRGRKVDAVSMRSHTIITAEDIALVSRENDQIQAAVSAPKLVKMFQEWIHLWGQLPDFPSYLGDEEGAIRAFPRLLTQDGSTVYEEFMKLPLLEKGCVEWYGLVATNMRGRDESRNTVAAAKKKCAHTARQLPSTTHCASSRRTAVMAKPNGMTEDPANSDSTIPSWLPHRYHSVTETQGWKIMQTIDKDRLARFFPHASKRLFAPQSLLPHREWLHGYRPFLGPTKRPDFPRIRIACAVGPTTERFSTKHVHSDLLCIYAGLDVRRKMAREGLRRRARRHCDCMTGFLGIFGGWER